MLGIVSGSSGDAMLAIARAAQAQKQNGPGATNIIVRSIAGQARQPIKMQPGPPVRLDPPIQTAQKTISTIMNAIPERAAREARYL